MSVLILDYLPKKGGWPALSLLFLPLILTLSES